MERRAIQWILVPVRLRLRAHWLQRKNDAKCSYLGSYFEYPLDEWTKHYTLIKERGTTNNE